MAVALLETPEEVSLSVSLVLCSLLEHVDEVHVLVEEVQVEVEAKTAGALVTTTHAEREYE